MGNMKDLGGYDENLGGRSTYEVYPAGFYPAVIIEAERRESKNNPENEYLFLKWQFISGPKEGCTVSEYLNLWNSNQRTAKSAERSYNEILFATNLVSGISDSEELLHIPVILELGLRDKTEKNENGEYVKKQPIEPENIVKKCLPADAVQPQKPAPAKETGRKWEPKSSK